MLMSWSTTNQGSVAIASKKALCSWSVLKYNLQCVCMQDHVELLRGKDCTRTLISSSWLRCAMAVNMFITPTVLLAFPDFFASSSDHSDMILHDAGSKCLPLECWRCFDGSISLVSWILMMEWKVRKVQLLLWWCSHDLSYLVVRLFS